MVCEHQERTVFRIEYGQPKRTHCTVNSAGSSFLCSREWMMAYLHSFKDNSSICCCANIEQHHPDYHFSLPGRINDISTSFYHHSGFRLATWIYRKRNHDSWHQSFLFGSINTHGSGSKPITSVLPVLPDNRGFSQPKRALDILDQICVGRSY